MSELLKELMNRGYVVFTHTLPNYRVMKVATPADPSNTFDNQMNVKEFANYTIALEFCKEQIGWIDPEPAMMASNSNSNTFWQMELMYRHRGLGLQSAILGQLKKASYEKAKEIANERAEDYVSTFRDDIEGWEVRVRPCLER